MPETVAPPEQTATLKEACKKARASLKGLDPPAVVNARVTAYQREWLEEVERRRREREKEEKREREFQAKAAERKRQAKRDRDRRYRERKAAEKRWEKDVQTAALALFEAGEVSSPPNGKADAEGLRIARIVLSSLSSSPLSRNERSA